MTIAPMPLPPSIFLGPGANVFRRCCGLSRVLAHVVGSSAPQNKASALGHGQNLAGQGVAARRMVASIDCRFQPLSCAASRHQGHRVSYAPATRVAKLCGSSLRATHRRNQLSGPSPSIAFNARIRHSKNGKNGLPIFRAPGQEPGGTGVGYGQNLRPGIHRKHGLEKRTAYYVLLRLLTSAAGIDRTRCILMHAGSGTRFRPFFTGQARPGSDQLWALKRFFIRPGRSHFSSIVLEFSGKSARVGYFQARRPKI